MATAQVTLTEQDKAALDWMAQQTGKSEEALLGEAVAPLLEEARQAHRRAHFQQARGMWADRTDLADLAAVRAELDRG